MGLLSGLFGGDSHSQTTASTSNVTNTQLAGGNIGGSAIYGSGNVVVATDAGAIRAATDISHAALALGATALDTGSSVAIAGLDHARDAYTSSLALVGDVTQNAINTNYGLAVHATDQVSQFAGQAVDKVARFATNALDSNTYIAGKALDKTGQAYADALSQSLGANQNALHAVEDIAQQVSQSAQQTTDTTVTRIILVIAVAAAAIMIWGKK